MIHTLRIARSPILLSLLYIFFGGQRLAFAQSIDFASQVRPILSEKCFLCHGPDQATRQADLRLDQAASAATVLQTDVDGNCELLTRICSTADDSMPPADALKQLTDAEKEILQRWIVAGAPYEIHWAYAPPQRPALPSTGIDAWCANTIDVFVMEQLRSQGLRPTVAAEPEILVRRLTLDVTGLPPTPAEVEAFINQVAVHGSDTACEQLIDRLMASPAYGEHMALPWLEASRYADTDGYQNDRYRYQDAWRDWVIRAFNENLPYDQFVTEQLAGDLLPNPTLWQQVATGFGRNHRINSEDGSIPEEWRTENVVDRVDTFGTVFLGLTVGCARCHDHKYDPISQQEYYQLFAYFNNIAEHGVGPNNGNSPPFIELPNNWPLLTPAEDQALIPEPVKLHRARESEGNGLMRPQAGEPGTVMVMHELPEPRETYVLVRGQYNVPDKSERLWPNVPASLNTVSGSDGPPRDRLEFARWLVDPENALTARVAVNRIWQQFFGTGLVETSENFGSQGTPPSHPQLLDWLAVEFVASGWDVRRLQRMILSSATYRQASQVTAELLERDPENRLLARGPRLRVPAFVLRDQALAVSGLLVNRIGGPSVKPYMPPDIWSSISNNKYKEDTGQKLFRRSLYTYWRRTIPPPTMMNFNAAPREVCTVRTEATNTPLQALTLLNNKAFVEAAKKLAERMLKQSHDLPQQIAFGFRACTARLPDEQEQQLLLRAYGTFYAEYAHDRQSAKRVLSVGKAPYDDALDSARLAAMTMTASLILNLDETITKQ